MSKSDLMKMAHAEARKIVAKQGGTYRAAMVFGMRRAHNAAQKAVLMAAVLAKPEAPAFMWLRGL